MDDEALKDEVIGSIISGIARRSPENAIAYLDTIDTQNPQYQSMASKLLESWSRTQPETAFEWRLGKLEEGQLMGETDAHVFAGWQSRGPESASRWLDKQTEVVASDDFYTEAMKFCRPDSLDERSRRKNLADIYKDAMRRN